MACGGCAERAAAIRAAAIALAHGDTAEVKRQVHVVAESAAVDLNRAKARASAIVKAYAGRG